MKALAIEKAKVLLNLGEDKEVVLEVLYEQCCAEFLDYCNREDIPAAAEGVLLQMLLTSYNRLGSEGLSSQGYSGVNESYTDGYPRNIINQLNRYRKLKLV